MLFFRTLLVVLVLSLPACAQTSENTTLYDDLGGEQGVETLVEGLIERIGHDEQIFHYFAETHVSRFREKLIEHFCQISDGPCTYTGDNMHDIHVGMKINEQDFNHLVDMLYEQMASQNIPHTTQNRLIARLAPLRKQIIYR